MWNILFALVTTFNFAVADPIRLQIPAEPSSLDPARITDVHGYLMATNLYHGLFKLDGEGRLQNALAASYSRTGKTYRFRLRKDAVWSDGRPVTAAQFVDGLTRTLTSKTLASDASLLFAIRGARDFFTGKGPLTGVRARKDGTLEIELEREDATLLEVLAMPLAAPIRKELYDKNGGEWRFDYPVTGPYRIAKSEAGQKYVLEANLFTKKHGQEDVLVYVVPDETIALNMLESARIDVATSLPTMELDRLRKEGWLKLFPSATTSYLGFNNTPKSKLTKPLRRRIAEAINKRELNKVLGGIDYESDAYLPPSILGSAKLPSRAKSELKSWPDTLVLAFANSATNKTTAEKIQNDLAAAGVKVRLETMDWKVYLAHLRANPPDLFLLGLSAPFNDAISHLQKFYPGEPGNYSQYSAPVYKSLLDDVMSLPRGPSRDKKILAAHEHLLQQDALVPLLHRGQIYGVRPEIIGLAANPFRIFSFADLRRKQSSKQK